MTTWAQLAAERRRAFTATSPPDGSSGGASRSPQTPDHPRLDVARHALANATSDARPNNPIRPATLRSAGVVEQIASVDQLPPVEGGYNSHEDHVSAQRAHVLVAIRKVPPATSRDGERLRRMSIAFVESRHFSDALAHGWSMVELFGISPAAPDVRVDGWGLVTGMALSTHRNHRLISIDATEAVLGSGGPSVLRHQRAECIQLGAVVWWDCASIINRDI